MKRFAGLIALLLTACEIDTTTNVYTDDGCDDSTEQVDAAPRPDSEPESPDAAMPDASVPTDAAPSADVNCLSDTDIIPIECVCDSEQPHNHCGTGWLDGDAAPDEECNPWLDPGCPCNPDEPSHPCHPSHRIDAGV